MDAKTKRVKPLTETQSRMLNAITDYARANDYPPTFREIADIAGMTVGGVLYHLQVLKRNGLLDWRNGQSRTIRILKVDA